MASIYVKGNKLYMSWYDRLAGKRFNRSLELDNSPANRKKAEQFAKNFQRKLDEQYESYISLRIVKDTIEKAFEHFLRVNSNKSPKTIQDYIRFQKKFYEHFNPNDPCTFITKHSCEEFLIAIGKENYAPNTLYGFTKNLKKFLNFLFQYNYIPHFVLNSDLTYKPEVKPVLIFSEEDIELMINNLESKNSNFRTAFYLLLYTGLRPSDILDIKVDDIDLNKKLLRYYSPKVKEYNIVPIHDELLPILEQRISEVKQSRLLEYATVGEIGKAIRRFFEKLGLNKKGYNLRTFRKTYISLLYNSGVDLATASRLVGHRKITTTQKYYTHYSISKLQTELQKLRLPKSKPLDNNEPSSQK